MSLFEELKRRNVVRVGIAYVAIAWLLAQVAQFTVDTFGAPDWLLQQFVIVLIIGLPLVLIIAWVFELTPEGIKLEKDVDRSKSMTAQTRRKLDRIIIVVLVIAVGFLLVDRFVLAPDEIGGDDVGLAQWESIAVLPFANLSGDNDNFADGLSESLLNLLAQNPDLRVAGRTSSFSFKGRNEDLREIGEALNVNYVLEGSVRKTGDQLRITAQLIKVEDGFHLWSNTYDRHLVNIFEIQDEVAGAIARQLDLRVVPPAKWPTRNVEAYSIYLEALATLAFRAELPRKVAERLDQAIELDPEFAKAHELKAIAYWATEDLDLKDVQELIYQSATAAIELDPSLILARVYAALSRPEGRTFLSDIEAIEDGLQLEPGDINLLSTWCYTLRMAGYLRALRDCGERLIEIEPLSGLGYERLAEAQRAMGFRDEARNNWLKGAALFGETWRRELWFDDVIRGEYEKAVEEFEEHVTPDTPRRSWLRDIIDNATDPDTGKAFLDGMIRSVEENAESPIVRSEINAFYAAFGYVEDFWQAIERHTTAKGAGWDNSEPLHIWGSIFPEFGYISHPKYLEYARESALIELWEKRGAPYYCEKVGGEWTCRMPVQEESI